MGTVVLWTVALFHLICLVYKVVTLYSGDAKNETWVVFVQLVCLVITFCTGAIIEESNQWVTIPVLVVVAVLSLTCTKAGMEFFKILALIFGYPVYKFLKFVKNIGTRYDNLTANYLQNVGSRVQTRLYPKEKEKNELQDSPTVWAHDADEIEVTGKVDETADRTDNDRRLQMSQRL